MANSTKSKPETAKKPATAGQSRVLKDSEEFDIPLSKLRFDPDQPRTDLRMPDGRLTKEAEADIDSLAMTMQQNKQLEAIIVRPDPERKGGYIIVVGETRTHAAIKNGWKKIRGKIRYDLEDPAKRLVIQLSENVNRKPLSDDDMAKSVIRLLQGDKERNIVPMARKEILKQLGKVKQPDWLTRLLAYGDEENKRVWRDSGIVDTVEKVYRITRVPQEVQLEIIRRCNLDPEDPMALSKPLSRVQIDEIYSKHRKAQERTTSTQMRSQLNSTELKPEFPAQPVKLDLGEAIGPKHHVKNSTLDAEREMVLGNNAARKYNLEDGQERQVVIQCRSSLKHALQLIAICEDKKDLLQKIENVVVEMRLPSDVAQHIASRLTGMHVTEDEDLIRTLQTAMANLK